MFIAVLYFSGANEDPAVQLPWFGTIALILTWGHAQTCFCGFLGFGMFTRARHAAICGVLVIPMSSIAGWVITAFAKGKLISWMCYILPPLAYSRTVGMLLMFGGGPEFLKGILQLWGYSVIYGGFAVLRLVRPTAGAELVAWVRIRLTEDRGENIGGGELGFPAAAPPPMDDDVARAQQEACGMNPADAAILIQKLTKTFDARANGKRVVKRAVDELCIAVQSGEMCVSCPIFDACLAHFASAFVHVVFDTPNAEQVWSARAKWRGQDHHCVHSDGADEPQRRRCVDPGLRHCFSDAVCAQSDRCLPTVR